MIAKFRIVPISTANGIRYALEQRVCPFFWVSLTEYIGYEFLQTVTYKSHKEAVEAIRKQFGESARIVNYKC